MAESCVSDRRYIRCGEAYLLTTKSVLYAMTGTHIDMSNGSEL